MDARKRLSLSLLVLILVLLVGAAGFHALGLGLLDALYLSVVFLTTTGARDVSKMGALAEIWSILVILIGATAAAIAFSNLLAVVAGGELRKIIGRRKLETKIQGMRNHHIICGYGRMGSLVCEELKAREVPFVVVDNDEAKTVHLEEQGLLYILGDATEEEILVRAGIRNARGLVSVVGTDADNVYVTLTARGLNSDLQIVALARGKGTESKLLRAGANRVESPHKIGALRMTNLLLRPAIVDFADIATKGVELEIKEVEIDSDSPLAGKHLKESQLRERENVMVVAIKRKDGSTLFSPTAETELKPGDTLITIGQSPS
jgi:voltage-gated potassium channel